MENMYCEEHSLDNVFGRFKVVEFPSTLVGLSDTMFLVIDVSLETCVYMRTLFEGKLISLEDAREISAHHRAFEVTKIDEYTLKIVFKPTSECVSKVKRNKNFNGDRFVFDIHLIQATHIRCCNNEEHAEIGRYYVCGLFEYCQLTHHPKTIEFGDVPVNTVKVKVLRIKNHSKNISSRLEYIKITGLEVEPTKFILSPCCTKKLHVSLKPTSLLIAKEIVFKVFNINRHKDPDDEKSYENFITYAIPINYKAHYEPNLRSIVYESMHKLNEKSPFYTYITEDEFTRRGDRKIISDKFLKICKIRGQKKPKPERVLRQDDEKYCCNLDVHFKRPTIHFCDIIRKIIRIEELFDIQFCPFIIKFGRVSLSSLGEQSLKIKNNSKYEVHMTLLQDECVTYTENELTTLHLKFKPFTEIDLKIYCLGFVEGSYKGTFEYTIENLFYMQHRYTLQVGNPTLMIKDKNLKFGLVTLESFVTSVPVAIYNYFNKPVEFMWEDLDDDIPFEISPTSGLIPSNCSRVCDIQYVCKLSKSKIHEIDFISCGHSKKIIPIELSLFTRKHSVKFLQAAVLFKDIPLNLEMSQKVKLENSSKEFAIFHVVEPLVHGFTVEPMHGILKPKMVIILEIKVKISCIIELTFEIMLKINNKETIVLPVTTNVVEPKLVVHPKHIYLSRIPSFLISYVPVVFQNLSAAKTLVRVLDTGDENMFNVYVANGNDKSRILEFVIEPGEARTVFIKVCDIFRREYDMYLPFQINDLLGPPDKNSWTTDLQFYINKFEEAYENNAKIKIKRINKDISYCRIMGVITLPWLEFSQETFEFDCSNVDNTIEFTITNISKYHLPVTIITSKLAPYFSLELTSDIEAIRESNIKFELTRGSTVEFTLQFIAKGYGRFVSVAIMYLDKFLAIPYSNLKFVGKCEYPTLIPTVYKVIFPPCKISVELVQIIQMKLNLIANIDTFHYESTDENVKVNFLDQELREHDDGKETIVTVEINIISEYPCVVNSTLKFYHDFGAACEIELCYCYTRCALTLHTNEYIPLYEHPYPYYPTTEQSDLLDYMNFCVEFLERWLFLQGFRRELYPVIPTSLHIISSSLTSVQGGKPKGINVTYLNFIRRVAGPFMKHISKIVVVEPDGDFKYVMEVTETYKEILKLLKCRGANIWMMEPYYLLSYDQFVTYCDNVPIKNKTEEEDRNVLLHDVDLYNRLNKQCWVDFILQTYKVFVLDSCFFECICVSATNRDMVGILIDWFNKQIEYQYHALLRKDKTVSITKVVQNLTTDLSDGIALASAILNYCPFFKEHFSIFYEINDDDFEGYTIHNTCLITDAMNQLKLYFPLNSKDLLQPNFLQMLFLSVHLYVVLPLFQPKDTIKFNPPLSRSSTRQLAIFPSSQETLIYNQVILNNSYNAFTVEKTTAPENVKKVFLNVKYQANFVDEVNALLIVQGYNKTRIFDSYVVFYLKGFIGSLIPNKKCKIVCPLYRANKSDILVSSPFFEIADFKIYILDSEPTIPVYFDKTTKPKFLVRRINLIEDCITLKGLSKESTPQQEVTEQKLSFYMTCLSTQVASSWIWFCSDIGEFFIKVTMQPRWDLALDMLQARLTSWPLQTCSCGEACECYRSTILLIPHRNELVLKCLRTALLENASNTMMTIFDKLIESVTGKLILAKLFEECGTDMLEVGHILKDEITYRITSRTLLPRLDQAKLHQHSDSVFTLPVTIPSPDHAEKFSVIFTSECGLDVRTYRVIFIEDKIQTEYE